MQFDAKQRRAALRSFMGRTGLTVVSRWEKKADLGDGTLRKFLDGKSNTLTDKTYQALASAAAELLEEQITVADLQGETPPHHSEDHDPVSTEPLRRNPLEMASTPLIIRRSVVNTARGGTTLIYKDKAGEIDRIKQFQYALQAFCIEAPDDLMDPAWLTRDTLIIDPAKAPAARDHCLFVKDPDANPLDAVLRQLVRIEATAWIVREHRGRKTDYELLFTAFPAAWPVVGVIKR